MEPHRTFIINIYNIDKTQSTESDVETNENNYRLSCAKS